MERHKRTHTAEELYKCNFCKKAFASSEALKLHSRKHAKEKPSKWKLCDTAFSRSDVFNYHARSNAAESKFSESIVPTIEQECHASAFHKRFSTDYENCVDGKLLSATTVTAQDLSVQRKNPTEVEERCSGVHSRIRDYVDALIFRPYGCGMCDQMFEIEKEFMEHCYHHYCDAPEKDTFLEIFEIQLCSYFPRTLKTD